MSIFGLLAVVCILVAVSITTQRRVSALSQSSDQTNRVSSIYQDARFWVGQEESLERKYRLEPAPDVLALHVAAEHKLDGDFRQLLQIDPSATNRAVISRLLALHVQYERASAAMFRAVDAHNTPLVTHFDHAVVDPVFGAMEVIVYRNAGIKAIRSQAGSASLRRNETAATKAIVIEAVLGLALIVGFGLIIAYFRRRLDGAHRDEVTRLAEIAITDPLTGLRNHRAFHEDLARGLHRADRSRVPMSLIMLDLDGLKSVNDSLGHQAGDERLETLSAAISTTERGSDCAYRVGGDEFAVILDGTRAWDAMEFTQRLRTSLAAGDHGVSVSASAGISESRGFRDKEALIREADVALLTVKRLGQDAAVYTAEMDSQVTTPDTPSEDHEQKLTSALAVAVDAKDSYTRSHCQTVSQLCALIAGELGIKQDHLPSIRLAGLLHDVGKIGVPDAILSKPGKLTDDEYERMKAHSVLGYEIVSAAGMLSEARWVRHHHERYDGHGYPDGLSGEAIPLESRIIYVADSFEAMTSDRPYRNAPGREFAIQELRRHSGTQFDPRAVHALCEVLKDSPARVTREAAPERAPQLSQV